MQTAEHVLLQGSQTGDRLLVQKKASHINRCVPTQDMGLGLTSAACNRLYIKPYGIPWAAARTSPATVSGSPSSGACAKSGSSERAPRRQPSMRCSSERTRSLPFSAPPVTQGLGLHASDITHLVSRLSCLGAFMRCSSERTRIHALQQRAHAHPCAPCHSARRLPYVGFGASSRHPGVSASQLFDGLHALQQ